MFVARPPRVLAYPSPPPPVQTMLQEKLRNRCQNSWQQKKHRPSLSRSGTSRLQQKKLEQHGWSQNGYGGAGTHTRAHRPFHTHACTPPFSTCIVPFGPLPKNAHTGAGSTWTRILSKTLVHMDKPRRDCCGHHRSRSAPPAKSWGSVFAGRLRQLGVRGDDPHEHVRGVLIPQDKIGPVIAAVEIARPPLLKSRNPRRLMRLNLL